jgi:hypothetical protein
MCEQRQIKKKKKKICFIIPQKYRIIPKNPHSFYFSFFVWMLLFPEIVLNELLQAKNDRFSLVQVFFIRFKTLKLICHNFSNIILLFIFTV